MSLALLSTGNPKTLKGEAMGFLSFILHLAPSWLSGYNTCPMASDNCAAACLNISGHAGIFKPGETTNNIQRARIRKTVMYFEQHETFLAQLVHDITLGIKQAARRGLTPVFRLNGTSDIRWESVPVTIGGVTYPNVMSAFPHVTFYDYTKLPNRRELPPNYHLTFSRSETNDEAVRQWLAKGGNVAVVFSTKKGKPLPATWNGYSVVDGDETDLRFRDPQNVIVGLRGKGKAKKGEHGGFVVAV